MPETYTTYYHSPVGLLKISGTNDYISEVSFHDTTQKVEGNKKNLPPMIIQCIEQLIQYFHGERRQFEIPINPHNGAILEYFRANYRIAGDYVFPILDPSIHKTSKQVPHLFC